MCVLVYPSTSRFVWTKTLIFRHKFKKIKVAQLFSLMSRSTIESFIQFGPRSKSCWQVKVIGALRVVPRYPPSCLFVGPSVPPFFPSSIVRFFPSSPILRPPSRLLPPFLLTLLPSLLSSLSLPPSFLPSFIPPSFLPSSPSFLSPSLPFLPLSFPFLSHSIPPFSFLPSLPSWFN